MLCQRCQKPVSEEDARSYSGEILCEDCYMDALSPSRTCDPWATYTAKRLKDQVLSPVGEKIYERISREPRPTFEELMELTGLDARDLEREIAALRHAELLKAVRLPDGKKAFAPFSE